MRTKIVINPAYGHLKDFITALPENFSSLGEVIYGGRNEIRVIEQQGELLNVKQYGVPLFINRPIYTWIRFPKAVRAYEFAHKLLIKDVPTPEPIAYILIYKGGLLERSYFISRQVPYSRRFYEFGTPPIEGREEIISAFARFTAELHDKEIYHKDYSPGNILFDRVNDKWEFCLVDINRMQFGLVPLRKGCANFARLWGQKPFFSLLAKEYAIARGADPSLCEELILKYRKKFWKKHSKKHPPKYVLDL